MNLTHVLAFHRVATAGSFVAAARFAGVSQPTLSTQVRQLEQTTGLELFARSGRQIRLTSDGERLLMATRQLVHCIGEVEQVLTANAGQTRGVLKVAADSALHVIPVLAEMKRTHAGLRFSLAIANSSVVLKTVENGSADVGVSARRPESACLQALKLREDRLVLLVPKGDRWASRKQINLAELAGRDLVSREQGSMTREVLEAQLRELHVSPAQVLDVETREGVMEAVAAAFGVGVVFQSEAGNDPRLIRLSIRGADLAVAEYVVTRRDRPSSVLITRFLETAQLVALRRRWIGTAAGLRSALR
ncbi:MAG: LysR substrate-binding domain-containing protein [Hyphomicrobiaceae bacterium]